jgi:hypothetical protein
MCAFGLHELVRHQAAHERNVAVPVDAVETILDVMIAQILQCAVQARNAVNVRISAPGRHGNKNSLGHLSST